jgi:hypothetical protein
MRTLALPVLALPAREGPGDEPSPPGNPTIDTKRWEMTSEFDS